MNHIEPFTNKVNIVLSVITAFLSYVFGDQWFLFVAFLGLNIGDWITRWIAAYLTGTENSHKGWTGILKKLVYWIMIALGFGMSAIFIEIGKVIGIDLRITSLLGWFVLASLTFNEIRSILENLLDIPNVKVPTILTKGLEAAHKTIETASKASMPDDQNEGEKE